MPWIHIEWGAEGALTGIVMTDDDAEPIAECVKMLITREDDYTQRGAVTMEFVVPDLVKFNEATKSRDEPKKKNKAQLKSKSGEIKQIRKGLDEFGIPIQDDPLPESWDQRKWRNAKWKVAYNDEREFYSVEDISELRAVARDYKIECKGISNKGKILDLVAEAIADEMVKDPTLKPKAKAKLKKPEPKIDRNTDLWDDIFDEWQLYYSELRKVELVDVAVEEELDVQGMTKGEIIKLLSDYAADDEYLRRRGNLPVKKKTAPAKS